MLTRTFSLRAPFALLLTALLAACGGSDEIGNTVYVSGVSQNLRVSKSGHFNLDVAGHGHDVHIEPGNRLRKLLVAGSNHNILVPSGVSIDEESINLLNYQRQYQGAARYISVIDEMTQTLLSLVG